MLGPGEAHLCPAPAGCNHPLPGLCHPASFQPVESAAVPARGYQLFLEDAGGVGIKGVAEVQGNIHSLFLIPQVGLLVREGDQVAQAQPAHQESMLCGPDPLVVL